MKSFDVNKGTDGLKKIISRILIMGVLLELVTLAGNLLFCTVAFPWYHVERGLMTGEKIKFLFMGSSLTTACIVPEVFAQEVSASSSTKIRALNLGTPYLTLAQHYFGLIRLTKNFPEKLRGVVVFLEAPFGLPDMSTWSDRWMSEGYPERLSETIDWCSLPSFLGESDGEIEKKLSVTFTKLSTMFGKKGRGTGFLSRKLHQIGFFADTESKALQGGGEIRTRTEQSLKNRKLIVWIVSNGIVAQKEWSSRNNQGEILKALHEFVKANGGQLILFRPPTSNFSQSLLQDEIIKERQRFLKEWLDSWKISFLDSTFLSEDENFHNLLHIKHSGAIEFSKHLASQFLAWRQSSGELR